MKCKAHAIHGRVYKGIYNYIIIVDRRYRTTNSQDEWPQHLDMLRTHHDTTCEFIGTSCSHVKPGRHRVSPLTKGKVQDPPKKKIYHCLSGNLLVYLFGGCYMKYRCPWGLANSLSRSWWAFGDPKEAVTGGFKRWLIWSDHMFWVLALTFSKDTENQESLLGPFMHVFWGTGS